ncbi:hypothetical protein LTR95_016548, partial [Oleoguttula sp. CCFEE 5521]
WVHKAFRGDNIVFSQSNDGLAHFADIANPWIIGFDIARPDHGVSVEVRPSGQGDLDYYYHPDVQSGASKALDWYSFGVLLCEIAFWKPLREKMIEEEIPPADGQDLSKLRDFCLGAVPVLHAMTGTMYAGVVKLCLEYNFPVSDDAALADIVATPNLSGTSRTTGVDSPPRVPVRA